MATTKSVSERHIQTTSGKAAAIKSALASQSSNNNKDQVVVREEKSPEPVIFAYTKFWTKEYRRDAEFELVIEDVYLPVHKYVLSASPYFQKELAKAEKTKSGINNLKSKQPEHQASGSQMMDVKSRKIKFKSPMLESVTVNEMILLLCHVYATDVYMDHSKIDEFRTLVKMAKMFQFEAISARCKHVFQSDKKFIEAAREEMKDNDAKIVSEWLDIARQYNSDELINAICDFAAENYIYIFGKKDGQKIEKWSSLEKAYKEDPNLYRRTCRYLSDRLMERGPMSLSMDSANTILYGVLGGLFAGAILPSWLFYILVLVVIYFAFNQMPLGVTIVLKKVFEGFMTGIVSSTLEAAIKSGTGDSYNNDHAFHKKNSS